MDTRGRAGDGLLLALAVAGGVVLGPLAALWAFADSPCGPDSTVDTCVLAAPHATAVLLPLLAGPLAAVLTLVLAVGLRRRARARRRALVVGVLAVAAAVLAPSAIIALAPDSYPNEFVPRSAGPPPAGRMEAMSTSSPSHGPVTVTQLPLVRCAVCQRTVAHRPGQASAVLTKHYQRSHPEIVGGD